jgi:hypothetical protein
MIAIALLGGCARAPAVESPEPDTRYSSAAGCWLDLSATAPSRVIRLDRRMGTDGYERGKRLLRPLGSYHRAFWSQPGADSVMLVWARVSDGSGAIMIMDDITFRLRLSGDTLRGTTTTESDLVLMGEDRERTRPFTAVRTACTAD